MNWVRRKGLFPVASAVIRLSPAPALFTKVPGAVCWAGIRSWPVLPNVSRPSPVESRALSFASCSLIGFCDIAGLGGGVYATGEGWVKLDRVFCSGRLLRDGIGIDLNGCGCGRLSVDANGLLEPVCIGRNADCELFVAHGLLLPGWRVDSCCCGC